MLGDNIEANRQGQVVDSRLCMWGLPTPVLYIHTIHNCSLSLPQVARKAHSTNFLTSGSDDVTPLSPHDTIDELDLLDAIGPNVAM